MMKIEKETIYDLYIEPSVLLKKELPITLTNIKGEKVVFDKIMLNKYKVKAKTIIATKKANELANIKVRKITNFEKMTKEHILLCYPLNAQVEDISYVIISESILKSIKTHFDFYNKIYQAVKSSVIDIIDNDKNINNEFSKLKKDIFINTKEYVEYDIDYEKLFKAYIRMYWKKKCDYVLSNAIKSIHDSKDSNDVEKVTLNLPEKIL